MVFVSDTTLRDGAQAEGVTFSIDDKLHIIRSLDELGIRWIEAGNPGANAMDAALFERLSAMPPLRNASLVAFGSTCRPGFSPDHDETLRRLKNCLIAQRFSRDIA